MIVFPNSKINIGLNITEKRTNGYHFLETIFYPIDLTDILEFTINKKETTYSETGLKIDSVPENNLVLKAYHLLKRKFELPEINIHLHKIIPMGAGLGGGSSNAAFMLKALNENFNLKISDNDLEKYAQELGSDCPFFIKNQAVFAEGTGNIFSEISLDLSKYYILIVKPKIHISTKEAFSGIKPTTPKLSLKNLIQEPIFEWKNIIKNDFEETVLEQFSQIKLIKKTIYNMGALYAQMSGSGASIFGIFDSEPEIPKDFEKYFIYIQKPIV